MILFRSIVFMLCLLAAALAVAATGEKDYRALYQRGVEHNKKGEFDAAIRLYTEALALKPESAGLFFVRGRAYLQKDLHDKAIGDLTKAIQLKPDYDVAYNVRGLAYVGKNQKDQAKPDFEKACKKGLKEACLNLKKVSP